MTLKSLQKIEASESDLGGFLRFADLIFEMD